MINVFCVLAYNMDKNRQLSDKEGYDEGEASPKYMPGGAGGQ